jgi:hypothetical protein
MSVIRITVRLFYLGSRIDAVIKGLIVWAHDESSSLYGAISFGLF